MKEDHQFGKRLRSLRIQNELTLRELAAKININFTYLSKIENGVLPPPGEKVILMLAEVLNADKDELMTLAGRIPSHLVQMLRNRARLEFGTMLRKLRTEAGMTQKELARKVRVDATYLSKIENGIKPPPSKKIIPRLSQVLNVDKDELIALGGRIPSSSNRDTGSSGAKIFHDID